MENTEQSDDESLHNEKSSLLKESGVRIMNNILLKSLFNMYNTYVNEM